MKPATTNNNQRPTLPLYANIHTNGQTAEYSNNQQLATIVGSECETKKRSYDTNSDTHKRLTVEVKKQPILTKWHCIHLGVVTKTICPLTGGSFILAMSDTYAH